MLDPGGFLNGSQHGSGGQDASLGGGRDESPASGPVQRGGRNSPSYEGASAFQEFVQRPLDAVVDRSQQARPQFQRQGHAASVGGLSGREARSVLVDLDQGFLAFKLDHLAHEQIVAHMDELEHARVPYTLENDHRAVHSLHPADYSFIHGCFAPPALESDLADSSAARISPRMAASALASRAGALLS